MEKYCRTCFRHNEFKKFDIDTVSQISDIRIDGLIMYCLQVQISPHDRLPQQICGACLSVLNSMFLFRKQFYEADTEFRKLLEYAQPTQLEETATSLELELNLLDAIIPNQDFSIETFEPEPEDTIDSIPDDQPPAPLETQEIKIEENCIEQEPEEQSVVVKKKHSKMFECEQCKHRASFKGNLKRHQKCWNHTGITVIDIEEEADEQSVVVKYRTKIYECEQCNHRASFKDNLLRHQQSWNHTGIRTIEPKDKTPQKAIRKLHCCGECKFQTFVQANFLRHQRRWKHTNYNTQDIEVNQVLEKCPNCPHCGALRANLPQHIAKWCPVLHVERKKPRNYVKKYTSWILRNEKRIIEPEAPQITIKMETEENIPMTAVGQETEESSNSIISLETQENSIVEETVKAKTTTRPIVVKRYHSKVFECGQCDYRASFKGNLVRHHKSFKHAGIRVMIPNDRAPQKQIKKLLQCEECSYHSLMPLHFERHQSTWKHKQCSTRDIEVELVLEKCPKCPYCGAQRANLQQHIAQWCPKYRGRRKNKHCVKKSTSPPRPRVPNAAAASMQANYVKVETEENFDADPFYP
ncbi:zinc finger protein 761-like [Ochlerotatus camptorhynchus]|uniref:zinc finger protein 761-like n=1 Tax=Ochlerotatus camptorhynchus TaxID=644619 RepID=UPI0031D8C005